MRKRTLWAVAALLAALFMITAFVGWALNWIPVAGMSRDRADATLASYRSIVQEIEELEKERQEIGEEREKSKEQGSRFATDQLTEWNERESEIIEELGDKYSYIGSVRVEAERIRAKDSMELRLAYIARANTLRAGALWALLGWLLFWALKTGLMGKSKAVE